MNKSKTLSYLPYFPFIVAAPLLWTLSLNNFISHSEFWSISSGRLFGSFSNEALIIYIRPLFYALLKIPYLFELTNQEHIRLARIIFGFLAFLHFSLTWKLVTKISGEKWIASVFCLFLLSFHVYIYNIFRVRSDLLCAVIFLLGLLNILKLEETNHKKLCWTLAFLTFLISLTTPKSIYSILWLSGIYTFLFWSKKTRFQLLKENLVFIWGPAYLLAFIVFCVEIYFGRFEKIFGLALNYYIHSFEYNGTWQAFNAVIRTLKINFLNYTLVLLGMGLAIRSFSKNQLKKGDQIALILSLMALMTVFIHPERWDYFLASLINILCLPVIIVFQRFDSKKMTSLLLVSVFFTAKYMTYFRPWIVPNQEQIEKINELELMFSFEPSVVYFDGTGILPRQKSLLWFLGPGDRISNQNTLFYLKRNRPEFILRTSKLRHGGPDMMVFLYENYQELKPDIYVLKSFIPQLDESFLQGIQTPIQNLFIYDHHPKVRWFH